METTDHYGGHLMKGAAAPVHAVDSLKTRTPSTS